jgi:hypothetical protein
MITGAQTSMTSFRNGQMATPFDSSIKSLLLIIIVLMSLVLHYVLSNP